METLNLQMDATTAMGAASTAKTKAMQHIGKNQNIDQIRKTAQDFEAVYLSQMMQPMFAGTELDAPFGGGQAEDMYRSLMLDEYGKSIAKSGGIGIADQVMREMLRLQEGK